LVFLVAILTLFACNLWGLFEVPLPAGIAALGERANLGNFAAGAFATLLAVPCSAPFLGTALGFALGAGPREIIAIFLALGFGMALPYFLVAALPRVAALLPRPGRWMIHLRRVLGVLLAASAAWLLFVLQGEIGLRAALGIGVLMAIVAATLAWLRDAGPRWAMLGVALAEALLVPAAARPPAETAPASGIWRAFDPAAIPTLVRDGNIVFVDVTADWCLTCKVNERLVLDSAGVRQALDRPKVIAMRADWTRPDPAIAAYLYRFKRYGIPFNAVYGQRAGRTALAGAPHRRRGDAGADRGRGALTRGGAGRDFSQSSRYGERRIRKTNEEAAMTIAVGDKIPSAKLKTMTAEGPKDISTDEIFGGKKVVLFAVPGAFTPTCSAKHLPGFVEKAAQIKGKGVDTIACLAVNDAFVMGAWGKAQNTDGKVLMLADGAAAFTKQLGLDLDLSAPGMGVRSKRYAMVVDNGVVKALNVEAPGAFEVSSADAILRAL